MKASPKIEKRLKQAGNFVDNNFYLQYLRYFDIIAQVHSVVETRHGTWMLRVWRATRFGPEKYRDLHQTRFFRVTQEYFNKYIVPPEPRIAKAIEYYGKEYMMEIEVYDEHRDILETVHSGDFVVVTNIHYARSTFGDSLKLHGGMAYNRGISKIPVNTEHEKFDIIKRRVERALEQIPDCDSFVEFVEQAQTASMQSASASTSANTIQPVIHYHHPSMFLFASPPKTVSPPPFASASLPPPPTLPLPPVVRLEPSLPSLPPVPVVRPPPPTTSRRWKNFAAAVSAGKKAFAQPCKKIIIGDLIAVDWFGKRDARKHHFLTGAQDEHCKNLDTKWGQKVYCSKTTAQILPQIMGFESERDVPPGIIHVLVEDIPHRFEDFTVYLIDANHVPGAVMYVFEGKAIPGGRVLVTGDFRADKKFMKLLEPEQKLNWLTEKKFATVYLDNQYLSLSMPFPDRETAFAELFKGVQEHRGKNIYIPIHRMGREEIIEELSRQMMEPVIAYKEKKSLVCTMSFFFEFGIHNGARTIRVVKRNQWDLVPGEEHLDFVIFDISMLSHMATVDPMLLKHKDKVIRVDYSDHCSRDELLKFLSLLTYQSVVPCSRPASQHEMELLVSCSQDDDATLTACEEKCVIEHEAEKEENGKASKKRKMEEDEEERRRRKVERQIERDRKEQERRAAAELAEMQRIVARTKELEARQPHRIVERAPDPEPEYDDYPSQYLMKEPLMASTLEGMLESTTPKGIMADEEEEVAGPSHLHLNLDLEMDLGLDLPATPSPLTPSFGHQRYHQRPRHFHQHHHQNQNHQPITSGHLEMDDVTMLVQRADEQHRNLHMRLNSPDEPALETLHLTPQQPRSSWTPINNGAPVFSPQYHQETFIEHVEREHQDTMMMFGEVREEVDMEVESDEEQQVQQHYEQPQQLQTFEQMEQTEPDQVLRPMEEFLEPEQGEPAREYMELVPEQVLEGPFGEYLMEPQPTEPVEPQKPVEECQKLPVEPVKEKESGKPEPEPEKMAEPEPKVPEEIQPLQLNGHVAEHMEEPEPEPEKEKEQLEKEPEQEVHQPKEVKEPQPVVEPEVHQTEKEKEPEPEPEPAKPQEIVRKIPEKEQPYRLPAPIVEPTPSPSPEQQAVRNNHVVKEAEEIQQDHIEEETEIHQVQEPEEPIQEQVEEPEKVEQIEPEPIVIYELYKAVELEHVEPLYIPDEPKEPEVPETRIQTYQEYMMVDECSEILEDSPLPATCYRKGSTEETATPKSTPRANGTERKRGGGRKKGRKNQKRPRRSTTEEEEEEEEVEEKETFRTFQKQKRVTPEKMAQIVEENLEQRLENHVEEMKEPEREPESEHEQEQLIDEVPEPEKVLEGSEEEEIIETEPELDDDEVIEKASTPPKSVRNEEVEEEEMEEEELNPDLDNWSEGPPRSLKEAIARLQHRSTAVSRQRQHAQ
ncbi:unnamed protein product [Caenorhabditis sp. 36 PRJEB53466]|nr:unnamed protein product [Caenorhabditis sp. 36 PRJEB53466]